MNILGLHFGHDASVTVLRDGKVAGYLLRERRTRVKHALGLTAEDVSVALTHAGIGIDQIDVAAFTSTQNVELVIPRDDDFDILWGPMQNHPHVGTMFPHVDTDSLKPRLNTSVMELVYGPPRPEEHLYKFYRKLFPEAQRLPRDHFKSIPWLDVFINLEFWEKPAGLEDIAAADLSALLKTDDIRKGFHYPATLRFQGRSIPAFAIHHHMCHAASVFYRSGIAQSAILTHDGFARGEGYQSGLFYYGDGHRIYPLIPHHLQLGRLYDQVAALLGLGEVGGAGKLMGLAPYGDPSLYRAEFAGNRYDGLKRNQDLPDDWIAYLATTLDRQGVDLSTVGQPDRILDKAAVDIAAATQRLFEQTMLIASRSLKKLLQNSGVTANALCLSGGTALNCPANSALFRAGDFSEVHIEPCCDDGGLSIGAALHTFHNIFDHPRDQLGERFQTPYLGARHRREDVKLMLERAGNAIQWEDCGNGAQAAAQDLADDKVIAWFEGGSEAGPRALGHRSILANPKQKENWARVNRIKKRELWRPFAPAVLEERASDWFDGAPLPSPYMLFTADVVSQDVPAITHVDGSSRIQTVGKHDGGYRELIEAFEAKTGIPVVMNTSFNGPGEPIVETPAEALAFLLNSEIDAVYIEGYRVVRSALP